MIENAQRAIPDIDRTIEDEERIYRGETCPVVKFNSGPFKNRIYVRFRGSLVHVGNRKMIAVSVKNMHPKQEEFMNSEDKNGTDKS